MYAELRTAPDHEVTLPKGGYLDLRPDRPGWGVDMDMEVLARDEYVHWERKLPKKPDGSVGYV